MQFLIDAFAGPGAAFMYAITAVFAFGLAITLERTYLFWLRWKGLGPDLVAVVTRGDLAAAQQAAAGTPVEALVRAGAEAADAETAWDAMTAEAALVDAQVRQRVPYLATVGNVATMLGLLGTVYGLIFAFSGLADASAVERATRLSDGISAAMSTTAWGLLAGIPALAVHALLDGKAVRMLAYAEAVAARVAVAKRS